ncbi:ABC transporter permease [Desulfosarcina ovata]|uniref:Antibiotic ABC transporter permease n=1 Tax=Desulfosarcina ovata subsp. ovata TaxID=2752305 RepID=A0A5K8A964_9BACT|nr:ABC transporter permease [Desulfosarcina ovata]BBO89213.1 antibiotic ABC transporter permease [Desulfosarcina ovata subsp. ovata]
MNALRRILTLIIKELAMVMRDPKSRMVVIVPPIIQFFVFGYAATFDLTDVGYAVLDESRTVESRALLARFQGSANFKCVAILDSDRQIREVIDRQRVRLVLHLPADFSKRLHTGRAAVLQVIADGRNSNVASVALGYVNTIVEGYNQELVQEAGSDPARPELELVERVWFNENMESRWTIVSALGGTISMIVVMILAALSVAREREFGTFDQLLVAPFRPVEILIGKAMPGLVFGLADALLLSAAAVFWFHIPFRGSLTALCAALAVFMIAVVGVGLFVSALSTTMQQALLGALMFIMPAVILSGFTTPIENMPPWLQTGTLANPLRYVVAALRQVFLAGADTAAIWPELWPMLIIAGLTLPAAAGTFRHRTH